MGTALRPLVSPKRVNMALNDTKGGDALSVCSGRHLYRLHSFLCAGGTTDAASPVRGRTVPRNLHNVGNESRPEEPVGYIAERGQYQKKAD